jgi:hypothetical protein
MRKLKTALCLAVIAVSLYLAYSFGMPHYRYYSFESDARDAIRFEVRNEEQMTEALKKLAEDRGIHLFERNIIVYRDTDGRYSAKAMWSETVDILGYYSRTYDFKVEVGSSEFRRTR